MRTPAVLLAAPRRAAPAAAAAAGPTFLHTPPRSARPGQDLPLSGNLTDGADVFQLLVRHRIAGSDVYGTTELTLSRGDLWKGKIPGDEIDGDALEYYVLAIDVEGTERVVWASPDRPERVPVGGKGVRGRRRVEVVEEPEPPPPPRERRKPEPAEEPPVEAPVREEPVELAEEPPPSRKKSSLEDELLLFGAEETVSLATLTETPVAEAPAIASVIGREEIRAFGFRTAADVIKALPGFETSRDVQGHDRIAVRGIRSEPEVLVLLDGHELNNPYDARALLRIPAENLERVEAIRGPGSALYGAGAFLGVVNLVPRRALGTVLAAEGGTRPQAGAHALFGTGESLRLYLDADAVQTWSYGALVLEDSLTVTGDLQRQGLHEEGQPRGEVGDEGLLVNVGAAGVVPLGDGEGELAVRFLRDRRTPVVGAFDVWGAAASELEWTVILADLRAGVPLGESVDLSGRVFFDQQLVRRAFEVAPPGYVSEGVTYGDGVREETAFTTQAYGAEAQASFRLGEPNTLVLGVSFSEKALTEFSYRTNEGTPDALEEPSDIDFPQKDRPTRRVIGAFLQDQWRVVDPLVVTAGARVDAVDGYDPAFSPRVGVVLAATTTTKLKLLYGTAFRAPTFQELTERTPNTTLHQGRFVGDPDLEPVTITTFEGGVEQLLQAVDSKVRLRGDAFYNLFRNRIEAVDTSGNLPELQNREVGVDVFGAELEARIERGPRSFTVLSFSWFRARDNNPDIPEELHLLTDVPQYRANLGTQIPLAGFLNLSGLLQLGAERRNNARSPLEIRRRWSIPAYALLSAQLATEPFGGGWSLALVGENLLDEAYRDDVPRPDRIPDQLPREGVTGLLVVRRSFER